MILIVAQRINGYIVKLLARSKLRYSIFSNSQILIRASSSKRHSSPSTGGEE